MPGPLTTLDDIPATVLEPVADDPVGICWPVHALVIQPTDAQGLDLPEDRFATSQIPSGRSAGVRALLELDPVGVTWNLSTLSRDDRRVAEWPVSRQRRAVLGAVAAAVPGLRATSAVRVAIDGVDGAGKTVFADQLGDVLTAAGRPVIRASVDDFHRPRVERYRRGRDSPIGFWLDSYDYDRLRGELLDPLSPGGDGFYRKKVHDLASDRPVDEPPQWCLPGAVLVVDGLFLHREELRGYWDFSVWLEVPFEVTAARMSHRDGTAPDPNDPRMARYVVGQRLYLAQCQPARRADVVIDNTDSDRRLPP